jgi:hypothetical protein
MTIRHGKFLAMISDIEQFLLCISSSIASSPVHTNTAHVMYLGRALVGAHYATSGDKVGVGGLIITNR